MIRVASHVIAEWRHSQPPPEAMTVLDDDETPADEVPPELLAEARIAQRRIDQVSSARRCTPAPG